MYFCASALIAIHVTSCTVCRKSDVTEYTTNVSVNVSESEQTKASGGLTEDSKALDRPEEKHEDSNKDGACGGSEKKDS